MDSKEIGEKRHRIVSSEPLGKCSTETKATRSFAYASASQSTQADEDLLFRGEKS